MSCMPINDSGRIYIDYYDIIGEIEPELRPNTSTNITTDYIYFFITDRKSCAEIRFEIASKAYDFLHKS